MPGGRPDPVGLCTTQEEGAGGGNRGSPVLGPVATGLIALSDALTDWLDLGLRWLHVIAAMAWIGTSFYFVLLDQSLRPPKDPADLEAGDRTSVV